MSKPDGGPAFPSDTRPWPSGMTLRDYFAAKALQGYRCGFWQWYRSVGSEGKFPDPSQMANWAYADADAMLAERAK